MAYSSRIYSSVGMFLSMNIFLTIDYTIQMNICQNVFSHSCNKKWPIILSYCGLYKRHTLCALVCVWAGKAFTRHLYPNVLSLLHQLTAWTNQEKKDTTTITQTQHHRKQIKTQNVLIWYINWIQSISKERLWRISWIKCSIYST